MKTRRDRQIDGSESWRSPQRAEEHALSKTSRPPAEKRHRSLLSEKQREVMWEAAQKLFGRAPCDGERET